ncbi:hypothetical protein LP419_21505 [Massilia sp. H-1]|nr:hypothetical protein LP419_21505 [Massilia sp. H-1]
MAVFCTPSLTEVKTDKGDMDAMRAESRKFIGFDASACAAAPPAIAHGAVAGRAVRAEQLFSLRQAGPIAGRCRSVPTAT